MPSVSLLRTTIGGYEVFNLTSAELASFFLEREAAYFTAQMDGPPNTLLTFSMGAPFVDGSLRVYEGGVRQQVGPALRVTPHPLLGTFTFDAAPDATADIQAWAIKA